MSGKRLGNFRAGDRSEYLAAFGLSRFAFVNPAPRQEDFGVVDFLCVLAREEGTIIYPESAFFVQVKSSKEDICFDADAVRWISHHMDHPLFICICDKNASQLTLYSCSHLWLALFLRPEPSEIVIKLSTDSIPDERYELTENGSDAFFTVYLGAPILQQNLSEIETDPNVAYQVLEAWIRLDADNIARRRLGRIAVRCFWEWQPNRVPESSYFSRYFYGPNYSEAEESLVPMLTALGHNYIRAKDYNKLEALRQMLLVLNNFLDDHGHKIADGTFHIID